MSDNTVDILVYTTDRCPYCSRVKALLDARKLSYREINLDRDTEGRQALAAKTGMLSFPQVLINDQLIGGFQETLAADRDGRLRALTS